MTVKNLWRFVLAYVGASITIVPVALAGAEIGRWFDYHLTWWHVGLPVWALAVGLPSIGWSTANLQRVLRVRPTPTLKVAGQRDIPVVGAMADGVRSLFGAPSSSVKSLPVAEQVAIRCGSYVFTESDLLPVLRRAWVRQRAGDHAFSRRYWLERAPFAGDRDMYDALATSLEAAGVLVGRGDRSSGRLVYPPTGAIHYLRHLPWGR